MRLRHAAHWASWADCIRIVHWRPIVSRTIIRAVEAMILPKVSFPASIRYASHVSVVRRMLLLPCMKSFWKENCVFSWMIWRRFFFLFPRVALSLPSLSSVCPLSGRPCSHLSPPPLHGLRISIPHSDRWCRCGRPFDCLRARGWGSRATVDARWSP